MRRYFLAGPIFTSTIFLPLFSSSFHDPHWIVPWRTGLLQAILPEGDFASLWVRLNDSLNAHGWHRPTLISDYTGGLVIRLSWHKEKRRFRAAYFQSEPLVTHRPFCLPPLPCLCLLSGVRYHEIVAARVSLARRKTEWSVQDEQVEWSLQSVSLQRICR